MVFTIVDIPKVMRTKGWIIAAALMERWFHRSARIMSLKEKEGTIPPGDLEEKLVTMAWAMKFTRARDARDELIKTWSLPERMERSRPHLENQLRQWQSKVPGGRPFRFGDLSARAAVVDVTCQVNIQKIPSSAWTPIDSFYAAIGAASVKLAVSGLVTPGANGQMRLAIDEIGVYLRDTYDFNGDQMLGQWGPNGVTKANVLEPSIPIAQDDVTSIAGWKPAESLKLFSVNNTDFSRYRTRFAKGGDFVIFSDIERQKLPKPIIVDFS
ncbi:DUF6402 family protein [Sphingomonas sp. S2-65]|uniref:DUF6402 family protein n=1 Tax=Sphingomonas sp. S2-65 TaxID=2903960 RepID=UPI001F1744F4|nr:DUF6402 family protein [Sphingomonas sp. S2-65]UYY58614.1 DUF6402 family protein [Sphingomonas sp. S2-65]